MAALNTTGYSGGSSQFTAATAQSVAIQRCLQTARVNASATVASSVTQARTALRTGNATAATAAIQAALCSPVTATATAQVFAEIIRSSVGCNVVVRSALQSRCLKSTRNQAGTVCVVVTSFAHHAIQCCAVSGMCLLYRALHENFDTCFFRACLLLLEVPYVASCQPSAILLQPGFVRSHWLSH